MKCFPFEHRVQEAEKHHHAVLPILLPIPHCASLEDPGPPGTSSAGKGDSRSRLGDSICTSRGCPCSGSTTGAEPPSPKRQSFQNSKPESLGTPWLERTGCSMENILYYTCSLAPPVHSSAQGSGIASTTARLCIKLLSA